MSPTRTRARSRPRPAEPGSTASCAPSPSLIHGIVNGIDYAVWNPAIDASLAARYDAQDASVRVRCKGALQRELGLALEPVLLIVSIGRMVHQKGTDLIAAAMTELLRATETQIVLAGDGDPDVMARVEAAVVRMDRAVFLRAAPEPVVHRMLSAADVVVVVPSRYEPCAAVQQYAQRYGAASRSRTRPAVFIDTVVDCDAKLETGTGFLFEDETPQALVAATERALAAKALPAWPNVVKRVMRLDRSWDGPARRYESVMKKGRHDRELITLVPCGRRNALACSCWSQQPAPPAHRRTRTGVATRR